MKRRVFIAGLGAVLAISSLSMSAGRMRRVAENRAELLERVRLYRSSAVSLSRTVSNATRTDSIVYGSSGWGSRPSR